VYELIALPLLAGAVQLTRACVVAGAAVTPAGAAGAVAAAVGVIELDCAETGPEPWAFDACTVNV